MLNSSIASATVVNMSIHANPMCHLAWVVGPLPHKNPPPAKQNRRPQGTQNIFHVHNVQTEINMICRQRISMQTYIQGIDIKTSKHPVNKQTNTGWDRLTKDGPATGLATSPAESPAVARSRKMNRVATNIFIP